MVLIRAWEKPRDGHCAKGWNMILSPQAKERLAQQQLKYLSSLSNKKSRISSCWDRIKAGGNSPELLNELQTEVHRLSGSAGSYGLTGLGEAAQKLDRILLKKDEMSILTSPIADLMSELNDAFEEVIEDQPE